MSIPFAEFDRRLREADAAGNVTILGPVLRDMMVEDPDITFVTIEKRLRELESRTHLLAAPLDVVPEGLTSVYVDETPASYWVWISLHGAEEAAVTRQRFHIPSVEVNLARLKETGFLVPK